MNFIKNIWKYQTYVEALKNKNAFDAAAQKEAFNRTYSAVMSIISQDAMDFLNEAVGDLDAYIRKTIEAQVNFNKSADRPVPVEVVSE